MDHNRQPGHRGHSDPKVIESGSNCRVKNLINDVPHRNDQVDTMAREVESTLVPDIEKYKLEALDDFAKKLQKESDL
ncbi:hypothetical protein P378_10945 [Desulforamulus profundi]|uniref:Uncharacterized protein n=1 Tax=Desulforamulus profundi TaxID=1383067 RepID=A0A2C6LIK8_9FIRM|nr:hypothetical protein [Desulforamulus profundi]PHJ38340.1 hypothetical protein P378_10945 [Desulforamulus profundi]